ncbi:MAG: type II toxin-antitoxin system VapC family toxin, partial [Candidatus Dormibacteraceae bacterium]
MLVIDTSGLLAALDLGDSHHQEAVVAFRGGYGPFVIPVSILAEIGYMVENRLGTKTLDGLMADLIEGAFGLDCGEEDTLRIRELINRYDDLPLGFADAAVIACAERNRAPILT